MTDKTNDIMSSLLAGPQKNDLPKVRLPYMYAPRHFNDAFDNLGYNYMGKIFRKSTSPDLWANPLQSMLISRLETMMTFVLEEAKAVKKWFSIAHEKDTLDIN